MNAEQIESKFTDMGARFKVRDIPPRPGFWRGGTEYAIDIQRDRRGEFFELRVPTEQRDTLDVTVLQTETRERHLLLLVKRPAAQADRDRFLCGHDEREWFVAAVPGNASTVRQAKEALKPAEVRAVQARENLNARQANTRNNRAFRRQGEWFFVPAPGLALDRKLVLRNEPIRRGGGKAHLVEEVFRTGGITVHVCAQHPNGLTPEEYRDLVRRLPGAKRWNWRVMRRDAGVYARGKVRHPDHACIALPDWHRVLMNTETQTRAMSNVAFLD